MSFCYLSSFSFSCLITRQVVQAYLDNLLNIIMTSQSGSLLCVGSFTYSSTTLRSLSWLMVIPPILCFETFPGSPTLALEAIIDSFTVLRVISRFDAVVTCCRHVVFLSLVLVAGGPCRTLYLVDASIELTQLL